MTISVPAAPVATEVRSARARVSLKPPGRLLVGALSWYSRRMYGQVVEPGLAMAHSRPVLLAIMGLERRVGKWRRLDPTLKALAELAAAAQIECTWCVDFGYFVTQSAGVDGAKMRAVPTWRDSGLFTDTERRVLAYAEAMTATPPAVTDELAEALRNELGDAALVELTMIVAIENQRSRFNSALGLVSQGFSEACRVPAG